MKRRLLAIFLSLTLMLSLVPTAWAVENEEPSQEPVVEEPTVQTTIPEGESPVEETKKIPADGILTSGSYILDSNVELTADLTVPVDAVVTLDLNGKTLTGTGKSSVVVVNGELTVKDSSDDNSGKITGGIGYASGGGSGGGAISIESGGKCTLEGGTLTGNHCDGYNYNAGGVYAKGTAEFYMTGGVITGNTANRQGGGVFGGGSSKIVISGGEISDNIAQFGGGVCYNGTMTMTGGTIKSNTAQYSGEVDGKSWPNIMGGGIKVNSSSPLEFYGGEVFNNKVISTNDIIAHGAGIYGGNIKVKGNVKVHDNNCDGAAENIYLAGSAMLEIVGELDRDATLPVTRATQTGRVTSSNGYSFDGIITADDSALELETRNGELYFAKVVDPAGVICTMQVGGKAIGYDSLSAALADLPSDDNVITLLKSFDLGAQVSVPANSGAATITAAAAEEPVVITWENAAASYFNVPTGAELTVSGNIIIRGSNTKTASSLRAFDVAGTLNLGEANNASEYPKVEQFDLTNDNGYAAIYVNGGILNLYSGTLSQNKGRNGSAVSVRNSGTANLHGGTICNNEASAGGGIYSYKGTVNLLGTNITKNTAAQGGGVYNDGGAFTMESGEISENQVIGDTPNGGGICNVNAGTVIVNGGSISKNVVKVNIDAYGRGRGAAVYNGATFTINGGTVSENYCEQGEEVTSAQTMYCAGLYNDTKKVMTISGGTISDNYYKFSDKANNKKCFQGIGVANNAGTLTISGGLITGNGIKVETNAPEGIGGAGVASTANSSAGATFVMTGGVISENNSGTANGAGLYLEGREEFTSTATIQGGAITENTGKTGVYVYKESLSISGNPVISENKNASGEEKNLCLTSGTTISMTGGMTPGASIGVTMASTADGTVVSNGTGYNITDEDAGYFVYDGGSKLIQKSKTENQLVLANKDSEATYFTVTLDLPDHVTANKALTAQVKSNENYEVVLTVEDGYAIASVTSKTGEADAVTVAGNEGTYSLTVTGNTTITVKEKAKQVTVTPDEKTINGTYGVHMETPLDVNAEYAVQSIIKSYALKAGDTLPAGLTLSESGVVSGTPTEVTGDAGKEVTVVVTALNEQTAEIKLTVKIAKAAGSVTAPTAKNLTYTGKAQELISAGSSDTGTIQYKLDNGEYGENVPTATNAGTYTVYYKVVGDANHEDVGEASIKVTIAKADQTKPAAPTLKDRSYTSITLNEVAANDNGADAEYSMDGENWQSSPTFTGLTSGRTYKFYVRYAETANYEASDASEAAEFTTRRHSSSSSTVTPTPEPTPDDRTGFVDVPANAYFAGAVEWAVDKGITNGLTDTMFGPYESCTRAQIVTFLWRAAGSPEPTSTSTFADVPASAYYAKAVAWAVENGITNGMTETTFAPNETCTRGQSVTFLYRALKGTASGSANFTDVPANAFYADAVNWAVANNVTNGTSATTFSPNADCTRAEIVTFLYRAYQGK